MTHPLRPTAELHHRLHGSGTPLLVMHGGPGLDHQYLRAGLDLLADSVQLVYYDHRGCGRSPRPGDWEVVTHASWAADADALRAHLGLDRIVLFGHSYGGFLALEYVLRHPDHVAGLVLCGATPVFDHVPQSLSLARARATPAQLAMLLGGLGAPIGSDAMLRDLMRTVLPIYFHAPERMPADVFPAGTIWSAAAFNHGFFRCLPTYDVRDQLHEIRVPTLIFSGDDDWITPLEHAARRLHQGIAGSELVVLERCGHYPFYEQPAVFQAALRDWLRRLGSAAEAVA
jgi:proline iminopeptidase